MQDCEPCYCVEVENQKTRQVLGYLFYRMIVPTPFCCQSTYLNHHHVFDPVEGADVLIFVNVLQPCTLTYRIRLSIE
jgi:hypothetical protein